jgi:hypothetical protein
MVNLTRNLGDVCMVTLLRRLGIVCMVTEQARRRLYGRSYEQAGMAVCI